MAIVVKTANPSVLLEQIKASVSDGTIDTWECDSDGDFTHKQARWNKKAWLRPRVNTEQQTLVFRIFPPRDVKLGSVTYAVYHGQFIQMLLSHFDRRFEDVVATALPNFGDQVSG